MAVAENSRNFLEFVHGKQLSQDLSLFILLIASSI